MNQNLPAPTRAALRRPRAAALAAITFLVAASAVTSFAESYRGLYEWANHHGLTGIWAAGFPLQVDVFLAVGELSLFVALADGWHKRSRVAAWNVTLAGLSVSVAGNVGHVASHALTARLTAAVPPLAAAAALAVGLGVLKRTVAGKLAAPQSAAQNVTQAVLVAVPEIPSGTVARTVPVAARPASEPRPLSTPKRGRTATPEQRAERYYSDLLAAGELPSLRAVARDMRVGVPRAKAIRASLSLCLAPDGDL